MLEKINPESEHAEPETICRNTDVARTEQCEIKTEFTEKEFG